MNQTDSPTRYLLEKDVGTNNHLTLRIRLVVPEVGNGGRERRTEKHDSDTKIPVPYS